MKITLIIATPRKQETTLEYKKEGDPANKEEMIMMEMILEALNSAVDQMASGAKEASVTSIDSPRPN